MSVAEHTAYKEITNTIAPAIKPTGTPVKRTRDYSIHSTAMKMAWEKVREMEAYSGKRVTNSHRGKLISWAFNKLRMERSYSSPVTITAQEASIIGDDRYFSTRRGV